METNVTNISLPPFEKFVSASRDVSAEYPDLVRPSAQAAVNAQVLMLLMPK